MSLAAILLGLSPLVMPVPQQPTGRPLVIPDASSPDDIIIIALRIPREKLPTGVYWNYQSMLANRIARERSQMFFHCALKSADVGLVRRVVDGEPNSATSRFSQGWIKEINRGCYPTSAFSGHTVSFSPITIADRGASRLERGVIVENVLKSFAPDAALTPAMTNDPKVKDRFRQREGFRNRLRMPEDRDAFVYASCLVERQPALATRLLRSVAGSPLERGLTQAIIIEGRKCVGGASRVTVDPSLVRVYVADAFYRWVVAARGLDSLIPSDA